MEIIANAQQTVALGANVIFTDTPVKPSKCIKHRDGSGLVTLRGNTNQCYARYIVAFGGNIAVPTDETPEPISLAIAIEGEGILSTNMMAGTSVVERFFNVSAQTYIEVPKGCCMTISVKNTSDIPILVQNANLIVTRVA